VFQRRFGEVVRLEVQRDMPESMRQLLLEELSESETQLVAPLSARDVHDRDDLLELGDLLQIALLDVPDLRDAPN
jgi:polyphosphate kinase